MGSIREYIFSVASAAVICGILNPLMEKKGSAGSLGKLFCGVFLAITLIRPFTDISFGALTDWLDESNAEASAVVMDGEQTLNDSMREVIKNKCEAYILDKAASLGVDVQAEVGLDPEKPYAPVSVIVVGSVAPYKKAALEDILTQDLGIPKEQIQWK